MSVFAIIVGASQSLQERSHQCCASAAQSPPSSHAPRTPPLSRLSAAEQQTLKGAQAVCFRRYLSLNCFEKLGTGKRSVSTQLEAAAREAPLALARLLASLYQQHLCREPAAIADVYILPTEAADSPSPSAHLQGMYWTPAQTETSIDVPGTSVAVPSRGDARRATTPTPTRGSSGYLRPRAPVLAVVRSGAPSGGELAMTDLRVRRRASIDCTSVLTTWRLGYIMPTWQGRRNICRSDCD